MMPLRRKRDEPHLLVVGMTGVRMGDRVAQVGCAHGGRLAAVAAKVGLSGRAVAFVPDDASAARARKAVDDAGVLVEIEIAPPTALPADDGRVRPGGRRRHRRTVGNDARRGSRRRGARSCCACCARAAASS